MKWVKRGVSIAVILCLINIVFLACILRIPLVLSIIISIVLFTYFIYFNIVPSASINKIKQKRSLVNGCELMLTVSVILTLEIAIYITCILVPFQGIPVYAWVINSILVVLLLLTLLVNGILRIFISSSQLGLLSRVLLLCLWWMPVVNILILRQFFKAAHAEYTYTYNRQRLNNQREKDAVCQTQYPILLVHGIFFRDWPLFNYWGRIPNELTKNGATLHYGGQRSTASVEESAEEIKQTILRIIEKTGCGKVNIIAHSKGGLDARYAVACLGMADYVASITTINTPHYGCDYVSKLLEVIPHKTIKNIGKRYETLFTVLGDDEPDFFSGLTDLTSTACTSLNQRMPDAKGVLYQSVASCMKSVSSAMFPLNVGYGLIKRFEGENDGLVAVSSMEWGHFLGVLSPMGRKGISHGDVIDLTRKNIPGFDVCEFYIDLVHGLKQKGL